MLSMRLHRYLTCSVEDNEKSAIDLMYLDRTKSSVSPVKATAIMQVEKQNNGPRGADGLCLLIEDALKVGTCLCLLHMLQCSNGYVHLTL